MTSNPTPKVTVGLPVYNGEKYLALAIESILSQTMKDFELVIVDNGSSDNTVTICEQFVEKDNRVRFYKNDTNIGASANHNRTLELACGRYFVWGSYDDIRHPQYLERCCAVLDDNHAASACHSLTRYIDADGKETSRQEVMLDLASPDPVIRFKEMIRMDHKVEMILALMRTDILKMTKGLAPFSDSDRVLMAEMCLHGTIAVVPEYLFFRREHEENSSKAYTSRHSRMAWFDPKFAGKITFPHLRQFYEYIRTVYRAPQSARNRMRCMKLMFGWVLTNRVRLQGDIENGLRAGVSTLLVATGYRKGNDSQ
jgi:glycosyltransferase involved in cell wall biosynthesis